jgi:phosphoserine aminotransferase
MKENGKAAYLDTGTWSAAIEAKPFGETVVVASSKKITITFQRVYSTG